MFNKTLGYFFNNMFIANDSSWYDNTTPSPTLSPHDENSSNVGLYLGIGVPLFVYFSLIVVFIAYHNRTEQSDRDNDERNNRRNNRDLRSLQSLRNQSNNSARQLIRSGNNDQSESFIKKFMPSRHTCEHASWKTVAFLSGYSETFFETSVTFQELLKVGNPVPAFIYALAATPSLWYINWAEIHHMLEQKAKNDNSDNASSVGHSDVTFGRDSNEHSLWASTLLVVFIAAVGDGALISGEILRAFEDIDDKTAGYLLLSIASIAIAIQMCGGAGQAMLHHRKHSIFREDELFFQAQNYAQQGIKRKLALHAARVGVNLLNIMMHTSYTLPLIHKLSEILHEDHSVPEQNVYVLSIFLGLIYLFDKACLYGDDAKHALYNLHKMKELFQGLKELELSTAEKVKMSVVLFLTFAGILISSSASYVLMKGFFEDVMSEEDFSKIGTQVLLQGTAVVSVGVKAIQMVYSHFLRTTHLRINKEPDPNKQMIEIMHGIINRRQDFDALNHTDNQIIPITSFSHQYRRILVMLTVSMIPFIDAYADFTGKKSTNDVAYGLAAFIALLWYMTAYNPETHNVDKLCSKEFLKSLMPSRSHLLIVLVAAALVGFFGGLFDRLIRGGMDESLSAEDKDHIAETYSGLFTSLVAVIFTIVLEVKNNYEKQNHHNSEQDLPAMDFDDDIESNNNNNDHQRNRHHSHNYKAILHPSSKMNSHKRNNQKHKSHSNIRSKQVTTTTSLLSEEISCHLSNDKPANNDNSFKYKQESKGSGVTFWGSKSAEMNNNNSKMEKEMSPDNDNNNIIIIDDLEPINEHENENDVNELKKVAGSPTVQ